MVQDCPSPTYLKCMLYIIYRWFQTNNPETSTRPHWMYTSSNNQANHFQNIVSSPIKTTFFAKKQSSTCNATTGAWHCKVEDFDSTDVFFKDIWPPEAIPSSRAYHPRRSSQQSPPPLKTLAKRTGLVDDSVEKMPFEHLKQNGGVGGSESPYLSHLLPCQCSLSSWRLFANGPFLDIVNFWGHVERVAPLK